MLGHWVGDDCHWDGGGQVGRQGDVQGGKGGPPRGGQRLKVLTLFFLVLAANIIQVLDSNPGSCNQACIKFHLQNVICRE